MFKRMSLLSLIVLSLGVVSWQLPSALAFNSPQTVMEKQAVEKNEKDASKGEDEKAAAVLPNFPPPGGIAVFSNGELNCPGTSYTYRITFAPPNVCGALHIIRNGVEEYTPGWACTDSNGSFSKSWTVSTDQTGLNIYVEWPDGSRTTPRTKVDDNTAPTININSTPGGGVPGSFSGTATDKQWGSGFGSWTTVPVTFRDITPGTNMPYWNGSCYCSPTAPSPPLKATAVISDKYSLTWSITPPPSSAHTPGHTYKWSVVTNDHCVESNKPSLTFTF